MKESNNKKMYVGGIGNDIDENELILYFSRYGAVRNSNIIYDCDTKKSRGFGFVEFVSGDDMYKALQDQNPIIKNKRVSIAPAADKDETNKVEEKIQKKEAKIIKDDKEDYSGDQIASFIDYQDEEDENTYERQVSSPKKPSNGDIYSDKLSAERLFEKEVTTVRLLEDELPEEIESHLSKGSIKACSKEEDQDEIKSGSQKNYKSESKNSNSSRKNDSLKNEKNDEYGLNQVPALRITSLDGEDKGLNKTKNPKNVKMSKKSQKNKKCSSAEERGNNEQQKPNKE